MYMLSVCEEEDCCLVTESYLDSFVTPWTVAYQAPLSRISQTRILKWLAISFCRGTFQPRGTNLCLLPRLFFTTEPPEKPEEEGRH